MSIKIVRYEQYEDEIYKMIHKIKNDDIFGIRDKTELTVRLYDVYLYCIDRISALNGSFKK